MAGATYALQYDLLNDFEPVALLSTGPYVLTARKTMPEAVPPLFPAVPLASPCSLL